MPNYGKMGVDLTKFIPIPSVLPNGNIRFSAPLYKEALNQNLDNILDISDKVIPIEYGKNYIDNILINFMENGSIELSFLIYRFGSSLTALNVSTILHKIIGWLDMANIDESKKSTFFDAITTEIFKDANYRRKLNNWFKNFYSAVPISALTVFPILKKHLGIALTNNIRFIVFTNVNSPYINSAINEILKNHTNFKFSYYAVNQLSLDLFEYALKE